MRSNSSVVIPACVATTSSKQAFHAGCRKRLLVVFEHGLKRLRGAPLRMFRGERLDTVQGERELDVERLLAPERPVVVEDGNPRLPAARSRDSLDRLPPRRTPEYFVSPHHRSTTAADRSGLRWLQPRFPSTRANRGAACRTSVGRASRPGVKGSKNSATHPLSRRCTQQEFLWGQSRFSTYQPSGNWTSSLRTRPSALGMPFVLRSLALRDFSAARTADVTPDRGPQARLARSDGSSSRSAYCRARATRMASSGSTR